MQSKCGLRFPLGNTRNTLEMARSHQEGGAALTSCGNVRLPLDARARHLVPKHGLVVVWQLVERLSNGIQARRGGTCQEILMLVSVNGMSTGCIARPLTGGT